MTEASTKQAVAVLGTGIMGIAIARNLHAAGFEVRAFNRTAAKAQPLSREGITVSDTAAGAVAGAQWVVTMLSDADACEEVMAGPQGALAALCDDAVWLQMSTVGVDGLQRLVRLAADRRIAIVDAPVVGTKEPAENAQLVVLCAASERDCDRAQPVFDAIASKVVRLGPAGAATRLKLVLNNWLVSLVEGLAETIALAESLDIEPGQFLEAIRGGPVDAAYAQLKGSLINERKLSTASFPLKHAYKDATLVLEAASDRGLELAETQAAAAKFAEAIAQGHGDDDIAAAYYASTKRS